MISSGSIALFLDYRRNLAHSKILKSYRRQPVVEQSGNYFGFHGNRRVLMQEQFMSLYRHSLYPATNSLLSPSVLVMLSVQRKGNHFA